jgi:Family of unknown function (DUF5321)
MAQLLLRPVIAIRHLPHVRNASSAIPRIAQPGLWRSMLPKFMRRSNTPESHQPGGFSLFLQNPATHIAGLAIFCGSQAIQVIYVKNDATDRKRSSESKIRLLGDIVERIKAGEPLDLKRELGTGDPEKEKEWQDCKQFLCYAFTD